jgi:hypothetical protein
MVYLYPQKWSNMTINIYKFYNFLVNFDGTLVFFVLFVMIFLYIVKLGDYMKIRVRSKLDEYLKKNGIKKTWLCNQIKCDKSQLTKWCKNDENGYAIITPSVGYLLRIQRTLSCTTEEIFEESE